MTSVFDGLCDEIPEEDRVFLERIQEHGWTGINVLAEQGSLGFSYTTGFWRNTGFPELIVFSLPYNTINKTFWNMFDHVKAGGTYPIRQPISGLIKDLHLMLLPVSDRRRDEHLCWSRILYRDEDFPSLQLIWPDKHNRFPWDKDFDPRLIGAQNDLTEDGWHR